VAKIGTSNPDRTISLKRLQCVVENKHNTTFVKNLESQNVLEVNEPDDSPIWPKHVALYVLLFMLIIDVLDGNMNTLFKHGTHRDK